MFSEDQPDIVTEEDVGNYVAELAREGLDEIDLDQPEQHTPTLTQQRSKHRAATFALAYGSADPIK